MGWKNVPTDSIVGGMKGMTKLRDRETDRERESERERQRERDTESDRGR